MRTLLKFFLYGFVASLFIGDSVEAKAGIITTTMLLCIGWAVVDWVMRRDWKPDVDYDVERPRKLPKNVTPMRRRSR